VSTPVKMVITIITDTEVTKQEPNAEGVTELAALISPDKFTFMVNASAVVDGKLHKTGDVATMLMARLVVDQAKDALDKALKKHGETQSLSSETIPVPSKGGVLQ